MDKTTLHLNDYKTSSSAGETILKMKASPLEKFVIMLVAALLASGITSFLVINAVESWRKGNFEWPFCFSIIPVLLSLGLIGMVAYYFIALFNSRLVVTISNPRPQPGEKLTLGWKIFNAASVDKLEIYLKGKENATFRTKQDHKEGRETRENTFAFLKLLETESRDAIYIGRTQFAVPPGTMHSFDGKNNKIQWEIVLHGNIKRRPDINCEYPITVMPFDQESLHKLLRSTENGGENG
jgi:hypothetical protein